MGDDEENYGVCCTNVRVIRNHDCVCCGMPVERFDAVVLGATRAHRACFQQRVGIITSMDKVKEDFDKRIAEMDKRLDEFKKMGEEFDKRIEEAYARFEDIMNIFRVAG